MNINDIYTSNSNWLKSADLQGTVQRVTIENAEEGRVGDKSQIILSFTGKTKKLGLNVTNARTIAEAFGPIVENWIGGTIELFSMKVDYQGKLVDGIRIRIPQQRSQQQPIPARASVAPNARTRADADYNPPPPPAPVNGGYSELDDEIPFAPEWRG